MRVARESGYVDWLSQPSTFKRYPEFLFRYPFDEVESLALITLARSVTEEQQIGGQPYYRLTTPSAGNLHPIELYIQVRGIKEVISGIYHVDAKARCFVLVQEIEGDGLESFFGLHHRFGGILGVVSMVPYRSEWKYGNRAIRYCYLDAGHQLGAITAACQVSEQKCTVLSAFDRNTLDSMMGFGSQEYSCVGFLIGEQNEREVKALKKPLIEVSAVDYVEKNRTVDAYLTEMHYPETLEIPKPFLVESQTILSRRSARKFEPVPLSRQESQYFLEKLNKAPEGIEPFIVMLRSELVDKGIYSTKRAVNEGCYQEIITQLLVDQQFVARAGMVMVLTSEEFSPATLMKAAAFVHQVSLAAEVKGLGCTGIGAFYDKKLQKFLDTQNSILYVCALGKVS